MSSRPLGARTFLLALALAGLASAESYWVAPKPRDAGETALQASLTSAAFQGPEPTAQALVRLAESQPGTAASGLARLSAGWLLLDAGKPLDAVPLLRHEDLAKTALVDYAQYVLARALEGSGERATAAATYLLAAQSSAGGPLTCAAWRRAAECFDLTGNLPEALAALELVAKGCSAAGEQAPALLRIAELKDAARDPAGAALAYDRLDREFPASAQALAAAPRLQALSGALPPVTPESKVERQLRKAVRLFDAGQKQEALPLLRGLAALRGAKPAQLELALVRLGRALLDARQTREALQALRAVPATSIYAAEAAYSLARLETKEDARLAAYESVATRFPGTTWGEEALLSLANNFQKDARDDAALPYYKRLLEGYPDGRYADRSAWRVGFAAWQRGRFEEAAQVFERALKVRPVTSFSPGFLYWAGRARQQLGQRERGRQLYEEAVLRFKRSYHGARAAEALQSLKLPLSARVTPVGPASPDQDIPEPQLSRLRQLLLIERLDEATAELRALPPLPAAQATIAWLETRRGRLRPALNAMKRAYPDHVGMAGDQLPDAVWRILYPLEFRDSLERRARQEGLDPALVAALVCQESTFEASALSRAGARGLMQIMPATGRTLARDLGVRYSKTSLFDPETSLEFGTRYLRDMLQRFGDSVERALAAYNAGPHRVDAWTAARPDMPAEEFVETIPFTETRGYVMTILAAREQYRRIYGFPSPAAAPAPAAAPRASASR